MGRGKKRRLAIERGLKELEEASGEPTLYCLRCGREIARTKEEWWTETERTCQCVHPIPSADERRDIRFGLTREEFLREEISNIARMMR